MRSRVDQGHALGDIGGEGHPMCLYLVRFDCLLAAEQLRIVVRFD